MPFVVHRNATTPNFGKKKERDQPAESKKNLKKRQKKRTHSFPDADAQTEEKHNAQTLRQDIHTLLALGRAVRSYSSEHVERDNWCTCEPASLRSKNRRKHSFLSFAPLWQLEFGTLRAARALPLRITKASPVGVEECATSRNSPSFMTVTATRVYAIRGKWSIGSLMHVVPQLILIFSCGALRRRIILDRSAP